MIKKLFKNTVGLKYLLILQINRSLFLLLQSLYLLFRLPIHFKFFYFSS